MNKNGENHNMKEKFNEVTTNIKKNFELEQEHKAQLQKFIMEVA